VEGEKAVNEDLEMEISNGRKKGDDGHAIPIYPTNFMFAQNWSSRIRPARFPFWDPKPANQNPPLLGFYFGIRVEQLELLRSLDGSRLFDGRAEDRAEIDSSIISGVKAYVHLYKY